MLRWFRGHRSWLEMKRTTRRPRWRGCGHETGVREGRTAGKRLQAGQDNSGEEFWLLGEAIDRDRARSRFREGGEALWTNAEALEGVGLAGHHAGAASKRGRTQARPNWLQVGANRENQTRERMSHLGAELGVAWRGLRRSRRSARRARVSGKAERRGQSARLCEMGRGSECGRGWCSKRSWGRGRGRGFQRRARVHARWSTMGRGEGGTERRGPRHSEGESERAGQRLSVWQSGPASQRGKRDARLKGTGTDSLAPLGRERERVSARGKKPPLTGGAHLSGSVGARPGWAELGRLGCFGFFFFPGFSNCFFISFL
jgi:hypothetical protein